MVAVVALKSVFCEACNGRGWRRMMVGVAVHEHAICPDCEGTGDVPADYFVERGTIDEITELLEHLGVLWPG